MINKKPKTSITVYDKVSLPPKTAKVIVEDMRYVTFTIL